MSHSIRMWTAIAAIALIGLTIGVPFASACPNCRENLSQQPGNLELGFALSIGLMLSTPFTILAAWAVCLTRRVRGGTRGHWMR